MVEAISMKPSLKILGISVRNIFFLNTHEIQQTIRKAQPTVYKISVFRGLPNTLKIKIEKKQPAIIWQINDEKYLVAEDGIVLGKIQEEVPEDLAIIIDKKNLPIEIDSQIMTQSFINFVRLANQKMKDELSLTIEEVYINETTFQVSFKTFNFEIFFNTTRDLDNQIKALKTVLEKHQKEIKQYVDLRVNGRVYYK